MDGTEVEWLVGQLSAGFDALQQEYQKLYGQHLALEKKLASARHQYNELSRLYGTNQASTPPLSLASSPALQKPDTSPTSASEILHQSLDESSRQAGDQVRAGVAAASNLRQTLSVARHQSAHSVKIWSGPSADRQEGGSSAMPSISESPLEQDFTIEGRPSQLGCPFASMAKKKLSSHAASVLSRYNNNSAGSVTAASSASRINGRESPSRRHSSRRESMVDPIKAEICGLSNHEEGAQQLKDAVEKAPEMQESGDAGVCPIRFLDQHSPEEVANYFEKHKHELPRSHEVCVMRYQSNEEQIRELDAKYGNLVSMIAGLGEKHKSMLPKDPEDEEFVADAESDEKVRKWASSVSAQAAMPNEVDEDREPHFERPLRDIRVGESPSRPWGIPVPVKYIEKAESHVSSKPAQVPSPPPILDSPEKDKAKKGCPFGHGAIDGQRGGGTEPVTQAVRPKTDARPIVMEKAGEERKMVFTGPVFIGYSAEDAARILRDSGIGKSGPA